MKVELDATMTEILAVFLAESGEAIELMEAAILNLEQVPSDRSSIDEVFRIVHTIKGDAASLGFAKLGSFAHRLENALDLLRLDHTADPVILQLLLEAVDELRQSLSAVSRHQDRESAGQKKLHRRLISWLNTAVKSVPKSPENSEDSVAGEPPEESAQEEADGKSEKVAKFGSSRYLRVDVEKLDELLTLVGEVAVARGSLTEELEASPGNAAIAAAHRAADRLHLELQELVMRVRMVPVGPAFRRHQRLVRDLSTRLGKKVQFKLEGGDVELDSSVLQLLQDPLSHMLRNAVSHGIETPAERASRNKPEIGIITLRTSQEGGSILIELEDDGRGIDRKKVKERAIQMGLLAQNSTPTDSELVHLIFEPGFSTSEQVTDISGRGVGMDVVRQNLETLRSTIAVESEFGSSTHLRIRLPLTLAIVDGLVLQCGDDLYIAPVDLVLELVDLDGEVCREQNGMLYLRGESMGAMRLRELILSNEDLPERTEFSKETVAIIKTGSARFGLIVDGIQGKTQVVIKPLPKVLAGISALAGTSVLGSGRVAFLLDVRNLVRGISSNQQVAKTA